jgi:D-alanine-D-alanine ligase
MARYRNIERVAVLFGAEYPGDTVSSPPSEILAGLETLRLSFDTVETDMSELIAYFSDTLPDVVLFTAQGPMGCWGAIQGMLDGLGVPYVGSPLEATALAANKQLCKQICWHNDVRAPITYCVETGVSCYDIEQRLTKVKWPVVAKPLFGGASHGVTLAQDVTTLKAALRSMRVLGNYLVEEYIDGEGREYSVGVLEAVGSIVPLPVYEIVLENELFRHERKFGASGYERHIPARVSPINAREMQDIAVKLHKALGCRGFSRTDMVQDGTGNIYVLELNTLPGLLVNSIFPQECMNMGLSYEKMLERLLVEAVARPSNRQQIR